MRDVSVHGIDRCSMFFFASRSVYQANAILAARGGVCIFKSSMCNFEDRLYNIIKQYRGQ